MRSQLQCCEKASKFRIVYNCGTEYVVCPECMKIEHWESDIKSIEEIVK